MRSRPHPLTAPLRGTLVAAVLALAVAGCGGDDDGAATPAPGGALLDPSVLEGPACGVDGPACDAGSDCVVFDGVAHAPVCVADPCGALGCDDGCVVRESYPLQVGCAAPR